MLESLSFTPERAQRRDREFRVGFDAPSAEVLRRVEPAPRFGGSTSACHPGRFGGRA